uniref:Uncharacterized protein n=1 Tax=Stomoxys calcitrans TaxID=35570 RepID=A0A1I8P468_STOCA
MALKNLFVLSIAALVIHTSYAAPTSESSQPSYAPFESRNVDELAKYLLDTTIHRYDAKAPIVETQIRHFMDALDMLIAESADDSVQLNNYKRVLEAAKTTLKAIKEDSEKCGLYLVTMSKLHRVTSLVEELKGALLWNFWTLSNIDERTLFVTLGHHVHNLEEYKESKKFFAENSQLATEAKEKAEQFVNENCPNYKSHYTDAAISH